MTTPITTPFQYTSAAAFGIIGTAFVCGLCVSSLEEGKYWEAAVPCLGCAGMTTLGIPMIEAEMNKYLHN